MSALVLLPYFFTPTQQRWVVICQTFNWRMLEGFTALESKVQKMRCRNGAQKLLGVLITIGEAVAYVVSGMYGDVRELGAINATLIILQVQIACQG